MALTPGDRLSHTHSLSMTKTESYINKSANRHCGHHISSKTRN